MNNIQLIYMKNEQGAQTSLLSNSLFEVCLDTIDHSGHRTEIAKIGHVRYDISSTGATSVFAAVTDLETLGLEREAIDLFCNIGVQVLLSGAIVESNPLKQAGKDHMGITPSYILETLKDKQLTVYAADGEGSDMLSLFENSTVTLMAEYAKATENVVSPDELH